MLEIGSGVGLSYCGKLFADFGAEVLKAEPPGGDPLRALPPLVDAGAGQQSAYWAWLNTGKRSIPEARAAEFLPACDVLLDGRPAAQRIAAPLGTDDPGLVAATLSWFGDSGPYRDFIATDATGRALAGVLHCAGPEDGPPSILTGWPGEVAGAIASFNGIAAALFGRDQGGRRLECSFLEANLAIGEYQVLQGMLTPANVRRMGVDRFFPTFPMGVYPCREGWLGLTVVTPAQWRALCDMLSLTELAADPDMVVGWLRFQRAAEINAAISKGLQAHSAQHWFEQALQRRLPFVVVPDMARLLATPSHRERHAFQRVAIGDAQFEGPRLPQALTVTPPGHDSRAPLPLADAKLPVPPPRPGMRRAASGLPLEGITILDLSMGWAGPLCTRQLSDLGATIIKVEATQYPDWWRGVDPRPSFFDNKEYEKNNRFNAQCRNKLGITLDLTAAEGKALLKRLVKLADAVVENYATEVLPKMGLDYAALRQEKPDLVMVSMPAFGTRGPWQDARAYGSTLEHASGMPSLAGEEGGPPVTSHVAHGDPVGGYNACAAVLVALLHRQRTGEGQHIDLSQVECMFPLIAQGIVAQSATGSPGPRPGNRSALHVPQAFHPCAGEDNWLLVAVQDDAAWRALCGVIGREELAALTLDQRRAQEDALVAAISAWTRGQDADAAMARLQAVGVAAGISRKPLEITTREPHLQARGVYQVMAHPFIGEQPHTSLPVRPAGGAPYPVRASAPTLGQHNEQVLRGMLGLSAAEYTALEQAGIIGTEAVPVTQRKSKASGG